MQWHLKCNFFGSLFSFDAIAFNQLINVECKETYWIHSAHCFGFSFLLFHVFFSPPACLHFHRARAIMMPLTSMQNNGAQQLASEATVYIMLEDVNDEIPLFTEREQETVLEGEPIGTKVTQVNAIDKDGTFPNNQVRFYTFTLDIYINFDIVCDAMAFWRLAVTQKATSFFRFTRCIFIFCQESSHFASLYDAYISIILQNAKFSSACQTHCVCLAGEREQE